MKARREGHEGCQHVHPAGCSPPPPLTAGEHEQVRSGPPQVFLHHCGSPRLHCHLAATGGHRPQADGTRVFRIYEKSCGETFRGIPEWADECTSGADVGAIDQYVLPEHLINNLTCFVPPPGHKQETGDVNVSNPGEVFLACFGCSAEE